MPDISIIICTRNRALDIKKCLDSLISQTYPGALFEIIVVNNNSTDNTPETVAELAKNSPVKIRYILETKLGLSNARNAGILAASADLLAFIDDDAFAQSDWVEKIVRNFSQTNAACVGGKVILFLGQDENEIQIPCWFGSYLFQFFGENDLGGSIKKFEYPHNFPTGGNMAFQKKVFTKYGLFEPNLGCQADKPIAGEETDFCFHLKNNNELMLYCPDIVVYHKIHLDRLNKNWVRKKAYWHGRANALIELKYTSVWNLFLKNIKYIFKKTYPTKTKRLPEVEELLKRSGNTNKLFALELRITLILGYLVSFFKRGI